MVNISRAFTLCRRRLCLWLWIRYRKLCRPVTKKYMKQSPSFYAIWFMLLIPIFAAYYWTPSATFAFSNSGIEGVVSSFYLSVITITTLGFGDISPTNTFAMILTSMESLLGITLIGLFLNALSHQHSEEAGKKERDDLTEDFNRTVGEIKKASQEMVEEVERSSQEMVNQITGGDSYPVFVVEVVDNDTGELNKYIRIGQGKKYPLYDVKCCFYEQGLGDIEGIETTDLPSMNKGAAYKAGQQCIEGNNPRIFIVDTSARNGIFRQYTFIHKDKDSNAWKVAYVINKLSENGIELERHESTGFSISEFEFNIQAIWLISKKMSENKASDL